MAARAPRNEANTVLIVFLILFVITTIGLGVSTYTGYAAEDNKEATIKQEQAKAAAIEYERDWYKYCSLLFLTYTGELQGDAMAEEVKEYGRLNDLFLLKRNERNELFGGGSLPAPQMAEQPKVLPKATVERILNKMEAYFPYKEVNGVLKIEKDFPKAIQEAKDLYKDKDAQTRLSKLRADNNDNVAGKALADLAASKKVYDDAVKKMQEDVQKELVKYQGQFKELTENNKKLSDALIAERERSQKDLADANDKVAKADKKIQELEAIRKALDDRLVKKDEDDKENTQTTRKIPTDIRIVEIDKRGLVGYINVGSADHVTPLLTFSVFGITPDGRVDNSNKATLEVVNVVDAHLSQVRVTGVRASRLGGAVAVMSPTEIVPGQDKVLVPVTKNDVVYNAAWHPAIKRHVAVAGIIDLNGDPRNAMTDFVRFLEKQNMVVDAYIDLRSLEIRGKINVQTDYLIIGSGSEVLASGGTKQADQEKLDKDIKDMGNMARHNGVEVVNVKRFLDLVGYRLPTTTLGSLSGDYRYPGVGGADAPADKPVEQPKQ